MVSKIAFAVLAVMALAPPAFATEMMSGHHACASGGKKGGCMMHHSMGHHATPTGDKKTGAMTH